MAITTKKGDNGETDLKGERVKKHHPRIEGCGSIDELNASIGVAKCHIKKESIGSVLEQIQNDLFVLQAEIANYEKKTTPEMVEFLDGAIQAIEPTLPKQTGFILPAGNLPAAHLHFARAVCRRAERRVSKLADYDPINEEICKYLNRLSDLLHLFARAEAGKDHPVRYPESPGKNI